MIFCVHERGILVFRFLFVCLFLLVSLHGLVSENGLRNNTSNFHFHFFGLSKQLLIFEHFKKG